MKMDDWMDDFYEDWWRTKTRMESYVIFWTMEKRSKRRIVFTNSLLGPSLQHEGAAQGWHDVNHTHLQLVSDQDPTTWSQLTEKRNVDRLWTIQIHGTSWNCPHVRNMILRLSDFYRFLALQSEKSQDAIFLWTHGTKLAIHSSLVFPLQNQSCSRCSSCFLNTGLRNSIGITATYGQVTTAGHHCCLRFCKPSLGGVTVIFPTPPTIHCQPELTIKIS